MCKSIQTPPADPSRYRHTCTGCDTDMSGYQCPMHLQAAAMLEALKRLVGKHSRDCAINNCAKCAAGNLIQEVEGE